MDNGFTPMEMDQIKKELNEAGLTRNDPEVQQLLEHWRTHSPAMVKRLEQQGILEDYAIVTLERFNSDVASLMSTSKMSMSEAQLYCQGLLLTEPEEDLQDL
jgi:hypothetical protein